MSDVWTNGTKRAIARQKRYPVGGNYCFRGSNRQFPLIAAFMPWVLYRVSGTQ
jgi:hypothetical protein